MICMNTLGMMKELTCRTAVSGREGPFSEMVEGLFREFCDEAWTDRFYNVIGKKAGNGDPCKKVLVMAHLDEIGLIVKSIDENGFIRAAAVGGMDPKILPAHEVVVHGERDVWGVIGAKPPHLLKPGEAAHAVKLKDLAVDTGMPADELKKLVSIGDLITLDCEPSELKGGKFSSKAVDNRSGVAALLEAMRELSGMRHSADVYFVASTQEELHLTGAIVSAYSVEPDLAVVIDACHGNMPDVPKEEAYSLGKGPAVGIGPVLDKKMSRAVIRVAKDENIPHQIDVEPSDTGTEAWATQVSRSGIPTVLLSIPVRYMHTAVETVHLEDIRNAGRLTARFISKLSGDMEVNL